MEIEKKSEKKMSAKLILLAVLIAVAALNTIKAEHVGESAQVRDEDSKQIDVSTLLISGDDTGMISHGSGISQARLR